MFPVASSNCFPSTETPRAVIWSGSFIRLSFELFARIPHDVAGHLAQALVKA